MSPKKAFKNSYCVNVYMCVHLYILFFQLNTLTSMHIYIDSIIISSTMLKENLKEIEGNDI